MLTTSYDQNTWMDTRNIALTYNLGIRHIRNILHAAYYHKKPWIYQGESYPLQIKFASHLEGQVKYLVHRKSLPKRLESIQPTLEHISLEKENLPVQFSPFCDWITIKQKHKDTVLPDINNGRVFSVSIDGEVEWSCDRHFPLVGSHDTKILLRVYPEGNDTIVSLSGNISRFGRPDNVFGLTLPKTIAKTNNILSQLPFEGCYLPPFSRGEFYMLPPRTKDRDKSIRPAWTGATLSRVDLTCNYSLGYRDNSLDDKADFLNLLSFVKLDRLLTTSKPGQDKRIRTVYWGAQTMRSYNPSHMFVAKAYDKACEVREHYKKEIAKNPGYFNKLLDFLDTHTLLRFEVQFKQKYLARYNLNHLGNLLLPNALVNHFQDLCTEVMDKQIDVSQAERLRLTSKTSYNYYIRWTYGEDIRADVTDRTFRHHRKVISDVLGIDISRPCFDRKLPTIRKIKPFPVTAPDWYSLDYEMS